MAEGSGLDFPKFQNQQHLENRLQEMCNAIIDKNKKDKEDALLGGFQGILDWVGFAPGIGDVFDGVNAVIYAARGMYVLALISVACVIFSVYADVILKPIKKTVKTVGELIEKVAPQIPNFVKGIKSGVRGVVVTAKEWVGRFFKSMAEKFSKEADNFVRYVDNVFGEAAEETIENGTTSGGKWIDDLAESGGKVDPSDIKFSDKFSSGQYKDQVAKRGWNNNSIADAINNPYKTAKSTNKATGNSATVYYIDDVHYVIRDDVTNKIIQISDLNKADWKFTP